MLIESATAACSWCNGPHDCVCGKHWTRPSVTRVWDWPLSTLPPMSGNSGWTCPRCHKVHAPHIPGCDCKPEAPQIT